ncbi:Uncharacterized protein APZ42_021382, partial [Daphnia magna]
AKLNRKKKILSEDGKQLGWVGKVDPLFIFNIAAAHLNFSVFQSSRTIRFLSAFPLFMLNYFPLSEFYLFVYFLLFSLSFPPPPFFLDT